MTGRRFLYAPVQSGKEPDRKSRPGDVLSAYQPDSFLPRNNRGSEGAAPEFHKKQCHFTVWKAIPVKWHYLYGGGKEMYL